MNSKIAVALVLSCILIGIAAALYAGAISGFSSHSFTLTANGRAYDLQQHQYVDVSLSVMGEASGRLTTVWRLFSQGGDLEVQNYGSFPISRGFGILVDHYDFTFFTIKMMTARYGGQTVAWHLRGRTERPIGNSIPVSFYSSRATVPVAGTPQLRGLWLT